MMQQSAANEQTRLAVNEILKKVDKLVKEGKLDLCIREIMTAKELDPSNPYVYAYEERLAYLKAEHEKNREREQTFREAVAAAQKRDEEFRREQEDVRRQEEERLRLEEERVVLEAERRHLEEEWKRLAADRATLAASEPEHPPQPAEESASPRTGGPTSILVIDDDEQMLQAFSQILSLYGYDVTTLSTSDEAYELLKRWAPALILCDVNLATSTMGGFGFYETIRGLRHLDDVPFIFITGLSDRALIRAGKEIGADDYLTKPVSEEHLIAAIKGKLKRFALMKKKR